MNEYLSGNLFGGELLADGGAVELNIAVLIPYDSVGHLLRLLVHLRHLPSDEPLHREERVLWVHHRLPLRNLPHQPVAVLRVRHNGGGGPLPLGVGDDGGLSAFHGRHGGVSGPQIDTNHLLIDDSERAHAVSPPCGAAPQLQKRRARERCGIEPLAEEHRPVIGLLD